MKFTLNGLENRTEWEAAGFTLPSYDIKATRKLAIKSPKWVHFGIGNIFRIFIGGIADELMRKGLLDRGLTCVETFDFDVVDKIYKPFDNLALSVILNSDGTQERRVLGSLSEAIAVKPDETAGIERLQEVFCSKELQIVSFTITEKGYALYASDGTYFPFIVKDIENGPGKSVSAMAILTTALLARYKDGGTPLALVSMDNCAKNGSLLQASVTTIANEWVKRGFAEQGFVDWLNDRSKVAFLWTMIDKITPRPSLELADEFEKLGLKGMQPIETGKRTYIAPFVNAERPQYLVIEDDFPNGRPALEKAYGVYMGDRETVNKSERMKVTVCLNPVHSASGPFQVVLGIEKFADGLKDPVIMKHARTVAYVEGMKVVPDPKILSPKAFVDELFEDRFVNEYLGDTNLRLSTDVSQGVGVRFGETVKAYVEKFGSAKELVAIPLGIAGWLRYMMAIDDFGNKYELAPDPMNDEISELLSTVDPEKPDSLTDQLRPILSNRNVFFTDLYEAGIGEKIEEMFRGMISGHGSARRTLEKYFG